ncbi:hypothetical protein OESDEN_12883 [Oesophagostomum dentatum]|uniref:Uncharacterized protein n=1 Tax=Oesophagostomum dentatum TaxID=61180 RepID=A0A0B1SVW3_OESDE|nr:hypothetical protein OESDEN_12883 [Oesophagostomum dentatum]
MDISGNNYFAGIDWGLSWPAFFLGFSIGAVVFTLAFSLIFLYYRHVINKTGGFNLRDEVA